MGFTGDPDLGLEGTLLGISPCHCAHWVRTLIGSPCLKAQVVALEQNHNPVQLEADEQRLELQQEVERLRSAQVQTERTLEARERAHRQRVSGLEEQVQGPPLGEHGTGIEVWGWERGLLMSFIT